MDRRDVLARTGTLAVAALAGCLSNPGGNEEPPVGGDTPTDTPTDAQTPTDDTTPTDEDGAEPSGRDASFEVLRVQSGQAENSATVSFGDGVTVEGTIGGRNGCYWARLASTDLSDGTLRMLVEAYEDREDDEACTEALVDVDYRATVQFEESLPERVVVEHDSMGETRTVADVER